jgi:uncharacterized protein (DUF1778 family)
MAYALIMASSPNKIEIRITEENRALGERASYILDAEAAQRFRATLKEPSPKAEQGLRRLIEKPSVLPNT